ncbi:hypothetical protein UFOVP447_20 [uncultured Caudovirales phage]|uniref:Uncharacterized protein n=1 Tax=uncultured Caudovirales phage TaxID=2100421 RepID=A0A6J5MFX1_9CAUD|nr:hypothetical protein UFOVP447_20 [uncultured Caudovirales phage]
MTKAIDLSSYVHNVWSAEGLEAKKSAMLELIEASHAKADTKRLYTTKVNMERNPSRLDILASNYTMSGEGMKVR